MGARVGVQKAMKSGTRWGGGVGQQTASGFVVVQSGPWWAGAHDGQFWVGCDWAAGGAAAGEGGGCSPDEVEVEEGDGDCVAVAAEEVGVGGRP